MSIARQAENQITRPVDTEVRPTKRPARSAAERLRIVEAYDSYPAGSPERGALLRHEGVYSSAIDERLPRVRGGGLVCGRAAPPPRLALCGPLPAQRPARAIRDNARARSPAHHARWLVGRAHARQASVCRRPCRAHGV